MVDELLGEDVSLWVGTTKQTHYPELNNDQTVYDVIVVGGGITGIVTAYKLLLNGLTVALIEKRRIVDWTTGGSTAKLTSQHYLIYDYLIKRHGKDAAQAFADANQNGIDEIEQLSEELAIDCDFSRRSAYVFTNEDQKFEAIKAEVVAALELGLPASFETTIELPFPVKAAIKFSDQAQFHPRKFLLALTEQFVANGGVIYENTEATNIRTGEPHVIVTNQGELRGNSIVQASGEPFWDNDMLKGRMWPKMSYALAVKLKEGSAYPQHMYITTDDPLRTIRTAPYDDGEVLIFGGESHEYDEDSYNPDDHYKKLIEDVYKRFDVEKVLYRWLAGDNMPYDRMPYIGPHPDHPSIYIVTGYRAWGLAWAMSAADVIAGYISDAPV